LTGAFLSKDDDDDDYQTYFCYLITRRQLFCNLTCSTAKPIWSSLSPGTTYAQLVFEEFYLQM